MRLIFALLTLTAVVLLVSANTFTQTSGSAAQTAENLQLQLGETKAKEAELNIRLQQLDEALKPENIEHSLAGVGSTRPEELREFRRRQLTNEKESVAHQLEQLMAKQARLEAALQTAETQAYQQSAQGTLLNRLGMTNYTGGSRLLMAVLLGCVAFVVIAGFLILIRRQG